MKGSEYEQFVFEKFERLFIDGNVTKNDHIRGQISGLNREIDVSVRQIVDDVNLLYIAQCKDWKTPVDIKVLGEFSAVIHDVQAAKGFLLCTSGFAKSNYKYALTLGIELVTIEDIKSAKWHTTVQIPFLYIQNNSNYEVGLGLTTTEALAEKNRDKEPIIELTTGTLLTENNGATTMRYQDYLTTRLMEIAPIPIGVEKDICRPNLQFQILDIWVPCTKLSYITVSISKKYYLKYLTPDEYSHIKDHVRNTTVPLHLELRNIGLVLDSTFVELSDDKPPVFLGLYLEVEESTQTAPRFFS